MTAGLRSAPSASRPAGSAVPDCPRLSAPPAPPWPQLSLCGWGSERCAFPVAAGLGLRAALCHKGLFVFIRSCVCRRLRRVRCSGGSVSAMEAERTDRQTDRQPRCGRAAVRFAAGLSPPRVPRGRARGRDFGAGRSGGAAAGRGRRCASRCVGDLPLPIPGMELSGGSPLSPLFGSPGSRSRCAARRAERCCGAAPRRGCRCWRHRGAAAGIVGCGSAAAPPGPALCPRRPSARPAVNPAALRCRLGVDERRRRREEEEEGGSVTAAGKRDVPRFEAGVQ